MRPSVSHLAALGLVAMTLSACFTPRVQPTPSRAVREAEAHRSAAPAARACPDAASPISVGFGFGEAQVSDLAGPALDDAARSLACHPDARAVIVGQSDKHGTDAEQQALAAQRAKGVADALAQRGVAPGRLTTQAQGAAPAAGPQQLVVLAEGRRW